MVISDEYHFLEVLVDTFADSGSKCNRSEFTDFCCEALDMVTFSQCAGTQ